MCKDVSRQKTRSIEEAGEIAYRDQIPAKEPVYVPIPAFVSEKSVSTLSHAGINFLYQHQATALEAVFNRKNIILSTGTSSGKSLCYQIPILESLFTDEQSCTLMIFPTKALAQDQYNSLRRLAGERANLISVYDGDTPSYQRSAIRGHARVILTNPDMLHQGMLPYHPSWARFFEQLNLVVLDEAHIYRGIFGAHTANVIRRMNRVVRHYTRSAAAPQFILCTATLSNARQLAEKLTGAPVTEISADTSGNGYREIIFLNPPIVNELYHLRAGSIYTAAKVAVALTKNEKQTLLFSQSRQSVESAIRRLRDAGVDANGYRSGYLAKERRAIEKGLKEGSHRCVVATNALELGMDIGGMDSIVSIGYPGSIASYYQRMGRAGRNRRNSSFFLIASQSPIDQYLMRHPEFLTHQPVEPALIDPDNLLILFQHLQCSLFEVPFAFDETFGSLDNESTRQLLDYFTAEGIARKTADHYFWIESDSPQRTISLRNSGLDRIAIVTRDFQGKRVLVGEVDRSSSYWMVHEGAIYFHNGECYRIDELNLEENTALAEKVVPHYTTEADRTTTIFPKEILTQREGKNAALAVLEVSVKNRVVSYKKKDIETTQILGTYPLDLPEETLETKAFLIQLSVDFREALRSQMQWKNDANEYGKEWQSLRRVILERDHYLCQMCGTPGTASSLHVHHIMPFRNFVHATEANQPSNLTTLCPVCHERVEAAVKMRSGLSGFASAFHQMAALFLECDPNDLNVHCDPVCNDFDGRPVIYLYETVPGGIGLSQAIFENFAEIVRAVRDLIDHCDCADGCPGCVGPAGEIGIGGKQESSVIAHGLLDDEKEIRE